MRLTRARATLAALLTLSACSGGLGGACGGCLQKIPGGFDMTKTQGNAVQARITQDGFGYVSQNFQQITQVLFPNGLVFDIPRITGSAVGLNYDVCNVAPSGSPFSTDPANPCASSGQCKAGIGIESMQLLPSPPSELAVNAVMTIDTNEIDVNTDNKPWNCLWISAMHCGVTYCSQRAAPPDMTITVNVHFSLDLTFWQLLTFDVTNISGVQLDSGDLDIYGKNTCGDIYCGLANVGFVKDLLVSFINGQISNMVQSQVANMKCRSCADDTDCPTTSHCAGGKCVADADPNHCVPTLFGLEGRANVAQAVGSLGSFGIPKDAVLDIFAGAGGRVSADTGLNMGVLGGTDAPLPAICVPRQPAPTLTPPADIDFDGEAAKIGQDGIADLTGYHVGIGVSDSFMNKGAYSAYDSGALCVSLGSSFTSFLSTGTFKTFLNSLGDLAPDDAPMLVALRPRQQPTVTVGRGLYGVDQNGNRTLVDPLLTLDFPQLGIDFYAMIQERYVRLFTLSMDLNLPLGLEVVTDPNTGEQQLAPVLGDLKNIVSNIQASHSEILAEDPQVLAQLIPAVIGLAQPLLASALKPISLPSINGFQLEVLAVNGIVPGQQASTYDNLGVYAGIKVKPKVKMPFHATSLTAQIVATDVPNETQVRQGVQSGRLPVPSATVQASAAAASPEYQYRVDGGLWNPWFAPAGGQFVVQRDVFLFQGHHKIDVRARQAGDSTTVGDPVTLDFVVDWEAPTAHVQVSRIEDTVTISAADNLSPASALQYRYKTATTDWTAFGPMPALKPADLGSEQYLLVDVRDEAGNVGHVRFGSLGGADTGASGAALQPGGRVDVTGGCGAGGAGLASTVLLFALALWLAPRRRALAPVRSRRGR